MDSVLLSAGLGYELARYEAKAAVTNLNHRIEEACAKWDERHPESVPCTGDILCDRVRRRHKAGCIGKTVPIANYAKGLQ